MTKKIEKKIEMGGQAVIEGVMMRSPQGYAIAVRKMDKTIKIKSVPYKPISRRFKFLGWPFIRGIVNLFEMLIIGLKGLDYSVNEWEGEEEKRKAEEEGKEKTEISNAENQEVNESDLASDKAPEEKRQISVWGMVGLMTFSLGLAMLMTVVAPNLITHGIGKLIALIKGAEESQLVEKESPLLFNLISGFVRASILLLYIWVVSLSKDIRRVFEFHGAEHKAVFAFEDNKPLTLEKVRPYTTRHPRCGTTFLGVVIIVSIIVFAFLTKILLMRFPGLGDMSIVPRKIILILSHIVFMPLVAGVSYEVIKYSSRHLKNPLTRLIILPGLLSQHLTTKEPDDEQLEVSIASLKAAMAIGPDDKEVSIHFLNPGEALREEP